MPDKKNPYDMFNPQSHRDPVRYAQMRTYDPVHGAINPYTGHRHWFLTRYDDSVQFLRDKRYGKAFRRQLPASITADWEIDHTERVINRNMLNLDDPEHHRLKSLVQVAFTPQRIAALRPALQSIVDLLFDRIDATVEDGAEFDLTRLYIEQIPLLAIAHILGIASTDSGQLIKWTQAMLLDDEMIVQVAVGEFAIYLDNVIEARQIQETRDDNILTTLIFAEYEGQHLTREELHSTVYLLITAGYETMVNFISNSILTLFNHRDQMRLLRDHLNDQQVVQSTIEELLRYSGPSHMTLPTWAFEDVIIRDKTILQGDIVHAVLFAANRAPQVFERPDRFDILRQPNPHIAFSYGIHHCLGASLARLLGDIAITTLLHRVPQL